MKSSGKYFPYALVFEQCDESLWIRLHRKKHQYDMKEKLRYKRPLAGKAAPLKLAVRVLSEISSAVAHLHKKHIVHQDLSSSNILLSFSGNVKLSDFGFARECKNGVHENDYIVGSPSYMSPEQGDSHGTNATPTTGEVKQEKVPASSSPGCRTCTAHSHRGSAVASAAAGAVDGGGGGGAEHAAKVDV
eukprot:764513-Hanusia_phi.AAC.2